MLWGDNMKMIILAALLPAALVLAASFLISVFKALIVRRSTNGKRDGDL